MNKRKEKCDEKDIIYPGCVCGSFDLHYDNKK